MGKMCSISGPWPQVPRAPTSQQCDLPTYIVNYPLEGWFHPMWRWAKSHPPITETSFLKGISEKSSQPFCLRQNSWQMPWMEPCRPLHGWGSWGSLATSSLPSHCLGTQQCIHTGLYPSCLGQSFLNCRVLGITWSVYYNVDFDLVDLSQGWGPAFYRISPDKCDSGYHLFTLSVYTSLEDFNSRKTLTDWQ